MRIHQFATFNDAVMQFNDIATIRKIDALNEMVNLYKKHQDELSWLGGNLNQAMKRANELAGFWWGKDTYYFRISQAFC